MHQRQCRGGSTMSDSPLQTPSSGGQEPTMVSVPVVGSTENMANSWNRVALCHADRASAYLRSDSSFLRTGGDADSTSESLEVGDDERMMGDGSAIVSQESEEESFLQESDLMDKKSPLSDHDLEKGLSLEQQSVSSSQDHLEMQSLLQEQHDLDGNYHLDNSQTSELESTSRLDITSDLPDVVSADLSPSSNSSASSLDMPGSVTSGIGLPPVSTIIRSSAKSRFDAFCRPPNINLIMGIPQYLSTSNSFDVINSIQRLSPCDALGSASPMEVSTSVVMDVPLSSTLVCSSAPLTEGGCIKANTVMSSLGPDIMDKDALSDMTDSEHGFSLPVTPTRTLPNFVGDVVPLREMMHISTSPSSQHLSPMGIEEMQKVAEISEQLRSGEPFALHAGEDVMLSPHFSVADSSYAECISQQRSQPVSAIETNVIMSTSNMDTSPKFTAAEIKAIEQSFRTEQPEDRESALEVEVIIPDCIVTTQSYLGPEAKAQMRSSIIEKNLLPPVIKNESTVITSTESISLSKMSAGKDSQEGDLITIKKIPDALASPSAITASVIQQLLRAHSPPTKTRTNMQRVPRGVITSVMSSKGDSVPAQGILVAELNGSNKKDHGKDSKSKPNLEVSEHSVISHGSKSPSSSDEKEAPLPNFTTTVLPSLFSNLSASALASLQSSLSSALPLTIQSSLPNISIGDGAHLGASVSPTLSSPPLSPILLPGILRSSGVSSTLLDTLVTSNCVTSTNNIYGGLLKTVSLSSVVKQEPVGSGPLPPFTVVSGLSPLVKRGLGASPAQIPVVTIKQEPGASSSVSASEFNPSIILNSAASIHLPSAVQLPVVVTSAVVATSTSALTSPVPSQASTIAFARSTASPKQPPDKKWNCPMCKNGSPCGLHPTQSGAPPQPVLSGDPAKPFQCTLCGKHLASKNVYQLHLRSHSGEKPFTCNLCGHHFSQKTSLTRHMRSHTGERPFPCDVCGKRFADKERIKIHMRTHTGEKPFACEVCGKRFSQKSTVKRHMSVHTGEKPFKCESCGKGFANRGNLNAHSKTHANT